MDHALFTKLLDPTIESLRAAIEVEEALRDAMALPNAARSRASGRPAAGSLLRAEGHPSASGDIHQR